MRKIAKILFILSFSFVILVFLQGKAEAQVWETTSTNATPASNREACLKNAAGNPIELNDFGVNISNVTFDVNTGTFKYKVNVAWGRCNLRGELSRAYAIYGPTSICPISGWYGLNGTATDCVKYVGNPAYSPPSDLKCSAGRTNAQCTTEAFSAAIIPQQDPGFLDPNNNRSYAQTFTIPNWINVRNSSNSYTIREQMCQYYKSVVFFSPIDVTNSRCEPIAITANWRKIPPPPPTLDLSCTSDSPTSVAKISITAKTNKSGDPATSDVLADYDKNPPTKPTPSGTYDIDSDYRDGEKHTFYVSFQGINKSLTIGPNEQCKIQAWYYPWLQTKNGDVVANGKIIGQQSGDKRIGSRPSAEKEAQYLIIASFAGNTENGSNFCSIYNYILTNPNATKGNCTNGFGYTLNNNTLGNGNDDNVTKGVAQAYSDLPESCRADGVPAEININSSDCPKGKIFKKSAGALGNIRVIKGRATILVDGNLDINGQEPIVYAEVNGGAPQDQPNLAIVVKGDVNINQSVNRTNALIYATGKINTCSGAPTACKNQLYSNGSLVAKNGFSFNRTYYNKSSRGAAEFVILNPVSILYPPPGISSEYFVGYNNGASVDAGEFQPRF